jgi:hypothetical protein
MGNNCSACASDGAQLECGRKSCDSQCVGCESYVTEARCGALDAPYLTPATCADYLSADACAQFAADYVSLTNCTTRALCDAIADEFVDEAACAAVASAANCAAFAADFVSVANCSAFIDAEACAGNDYVSTDTCKAAELLHDATCKKNFCATADRCGAIADEMLTPEACADYVTVENCDGYAYAADATTCAARVATHCADGCAPPSCEMWPIVAYNQKQTGTFTTLETFNDTDETSCAALCLAGSACEGVQFDQGTCVLFKDLGTVKQPGKGDNSGILLKVCT